MSAFIDQVRDRVGVEPVCRTLGVSVSAYYQRRTGQRSQRAVRHERLGRRIAEVHEANYRAYGYRRVHKLLQRDGVDAGRDQVARLMRREGLQGAKRRGKPWRTTTPDASAQRRPDLVNRQFSVDQPNRLWVADFVRHEAPWIRMEVRDHHRLAVAAAGLEAEGSLIRGTPVRVASGPDNDGTGRYCQTARVRQARRKGVREEPACESLSMRPTSSNLADLGWAAAKPDGEQICRRDSTAV